MPGIRPFRAADLHGLLRCIAEMQEAERALEPRLRPGPEIARAYYEELRGRCTAQAGAIFVADVEGEIAGFVAVQARVPHEGLDDPPGEYALVSDLSVLPSHRRRGIGRALLQAAESHARALHAHELRIGVLSANAPARRLYQAHGFTAYVEMLVKAI